MGPFKQLRSITVNIVNWRAGIYVKNKACVLIIDEDGLTVRKETVCVGGNLNDKDLFRYFSFHFFLGSLLFWSPAQFTLHFLSSGFLQVLLFPVTVKKTHTWVNCYAKLPPHRVSSQGEFSLHHALNEIIKALSKKNKKCYAVGHAIHSPSIGFHMLYPLQNHWTKMWFLGLQHEGRV